MSRDTWDAVDRWSTELLGGDDEALAAAVAAGLAAGMPQIHVSAAQGRLLQLLARSVGARRILEIGTLAGYSTIWLARALPEDGRLVTLEADAKHAAVARANLERAGLAARVTLIEGAALETLPRLAGEGPFDFTFVDADKASLAEYLDHALRLSRPGALIVLDNVVRDGRVIDAASTDASVLGVRRMVERLAREPRLEATVVQTVGAKGYDGMCVARVRD